MDSRVVARSVFRTTQTIRLMYSMYTKRIHVCMDYIPTTYKYSHIYVFEIVLAKLRHSTHTSCRILER